MGIDVAHRSGTAYSSTDPSERYALSEMLTNGYHCRPVDVMIVRRAVQDSHLPPGVQLFPPVPPAIGGCYDGSPVPGHPTVNGIREMNAAPPSGCSGRRYFPIAGRCYTLQQAEWADCPNLIFIGHTEIVQVDEV